VLGFAGFRPLILLLSLGLAPALQAVDGGIISAPPSSPSYIVIGFVGGFVRHTNSHHGPVVLAKHLQQQAPKDTHIQVFENRHRKTAFRTILRLLDANRDGRLSTEEKATAHIILFGQSWGASAAVLLARELDRVDIPVMLTVQVDSVAKLWQHDAVIPDNVAAAANFYQPHGLIHGTKEIHAEDDSKTRILGNYRFDYNQNPVRCEGFSWFDRVITPSHMQSECDPHLWSEVESLVRARMNLDFASLVSQQGN
jgi:pimeloyl-ACP methyl ester carboxylesterase